MCGHLKFTTNSSHPPPLSLSLGRYLSLSILVQIFSPNLNRIIFTMQNFAMYILCYKFGKWSRKSRMALKYKPWVESTL